MKFRNFTDLLSVVVLLILSLYALRLLFWSLKNHDKQEEDNRETLFDKSLDYANNEDE